MPIIDQDFLNKRRISGPRHRPYSPNSGPQVENNEQKQIVTNEPPGKFTDGNLAEGKLTDGKLTDGKTTIVKEPDGLLNDGKKPDVYLADDKIPDGLIEDGTIPDVKLPPGKKPDGKVAADLLPDGKETDDKKTIGKRDVGFSTEGFLAIGKKAEAKKPTITKSDLLVKIYKDRNLTSVGKKILGELLEESFNKNSNFLLITNSELMNRCKVDDRTLARTITALIESNYLEQFNLKNIQFFKLNENRIDELLQNNNDDVFIKEINSLKKLNRKELTMIYTLMNERNGRRGGIQGLMRKIQIEKIINSEGDI